MSGKRKVSKDNVTHCENESSDAITKKRKHTGTLQLNPLLNDCKDEFRAHWKQKDAFVLDKNEGGHLELYAEPFQLCFIHKILKDGDVFLEELKDELSDLSYKEKSNDLYQFHQSTDIGTDDSPAIVAVRKLLYGQFAAWLKDVTGFQFMDKIDATCARYDHTDVLLCHDDRCDTRRIAFIFYLSKNWNKQDGGTLDMFDRDENGQPKEITRSLVPSWNSLVFFEVTDHSYHQVSEVLTEDKTRVTLSGWFHAPREQPFIMYKEPPMLCHQPITNSEVDLVNLFVSPLYLTEGTHRDVNQYFEENSEIRLTNFFHPEFFEAVSTALRDPQLEWTWRGPANRRRYEVAAPSQDGVLGQMLELLQGEHMLQLLALMTDLGLAITEGESPRLRFEIQRWRQGCYTLLHDQSSTEPCLELHMHFNCSQLRPLDHGGFHSYVAKDEDEELLTQYPEANAVSLTFKDRDTLSFVKYVNHRFEGEFHVLAVTYFERPGAAAATEAESQGSESPAAEPEGSDSAEQASDGDNESIPPESD